YASASSASVADDTTTTTLPSPYQPDIMDWTPTTTTPYTTLTPRRPVPSLDTTTTTNQTPISLLDSARNPFRGTLPPAPEPPAFKARKPPAPVFKAVSEERKGDFLAQVMRRDVPSSSAAVADDGGVFGGKAARRAEVEIREGR